MKETKDILTLFESLSNHEIFTPPRIARQVLDLLPQNVWSDPSLKFLDPATKSGVFLREMFFRLEDGLKGKGKYIAEDGIEYDLDDFKQRTKHILKNMLYGIAISELTGYMARRTLYGVMEANTDKQISAIESFEKSKNFDDWTEQERLSFIGRNKFNEYYDHTMFNTPEYAGFEHEGNIFYPTDEVKKLTVENGNYEIEDTYYPFIDDRTKHAKIVAIKKGEVMKFDVIVGNPPYQFQDGGSGTGMSAKPIYQLFVQQAKKLSPKYFSMIMPSRWFSGGKGLDNFRAEMLNDKRVSKIFDFENSNEIFPGVDVAGGICYFLWDREHSGECEFINNNDIENLTKRSLNEFHVLVRNTRALSIIRKVLSKEKGPYLDKVISARKPFGIPSNYKPNTSGTPCWFTQSIGKSFVQPESIKDEQSLKNKWKVLIPFAPIAGQTDFSKPIKFYHSQNVKIAEPGEVCSETYLVANAFNTREEALNFKSYIFTKIFRFLLLQNVISQNITRGCFFFVPDLQVYNTIISDELLRNRWSITDSEWEFISMKIQDTE